MRTKYSALMLSAVIAVLMPFAYRDAAATGLTPITGCTPTSLANFTCAQFGSGGYVYARIEFVSATNSNCVTSNTGTPPFTASVPCTTYQYKYYGATSNQVVLGIPESLTQKINDAGSLETNCSQYITNGSGDPFTFFGKGLTSLGVCRLAPNLPTASPFTIATDASSFDTTKPLDWQVRIGIYSFAASLVGPVSKQPLIASTSETLTTKSGTLTYSSLAGQVTVSGGGTILDPSTIFMCVPSLTGGGSLPAGGAIPTGYTCDVVYFVDKDPNIQIGPNSTCVKYIGRTPIAYAC